MPVYIGDFSAIAPIWGDASFEAEDKEQFEYEMLQYVRDLHEGATDINIENIREVE